MKNRIYVSVFISFIFSQVKKRTLAYPPHANSKNIKEAKETLALLQLGFLSKTLRIVSRNKPV